MHWEAAVTPSFLTWSFRCFAYSCYVVRGGANSSCASLVGVAGSHAFMYIICTFTVISPVLTGMDHGSC